MPLWDLANVLAVQNTSRAEADGTLNWTSGMYVAGSFGVMRKEDFFTEDNEKMTERRLSRPKHNVNSFSSFR